jgi:cyanate lyase
VRQPVIVEWVAVEEAEPEPVGQHPASAIAETVLENQAATDLVFAQVARTQDAAQQFAAAVAETVSEKQAAAVLTAQSIAQAPVNEKEPVPEKAGDGLHITGYIQFLRQILQLLP